MTLVRLDTGLARKASVILDGIRRDGEGSLSPEIITRLKGLPALLLTSGLPATMAFFYAEAGTTDPLSRAYEAVRVALVDEIAGELGWDDRPDALGFFERIGDPERTAAADLARVTGRLEKFAEWLRRLTEALDHSAPRPVGDGVPDPGPGGGDG
jgi:CRISPR/Cas system CMR-associated protein Cmr5 small subunit